MNYECGECGDNFNSRSAICEDWRIEEKSLICPGCKHYLEHVEELKAEIAGRHKLIVAVSCFAGLMSFLFHAGDVDYYLGISWNLAGFGFLILAQLYWLGVSSLKGTLMKTRSIGVSNL